MLRIAARNVVRQRRRSLLAITLIAVGVAALTLANGYNRFTFRGLRLAASYQFGHLQIARPEFWEQRGEIGQQLMDGATLERVYAALREVREVGSFHPVLAVNGLIGTAERSTVLVAEAAPPDASFGTASARVQTGRRLLPGDRERIVIGKGLAEALGVAVGDWVTLLVFTVDGAFNAGNAQIVGLAATGMAEADRRIGVMPLDDVRRLLNTDGADRVLVMLKGDVAPSDEVIAAAAERVRAALQAAGLEGLQVKTRADLATFVEQIKGLYEAIFAFLTVVILGVVVVSVLESLTLSFFERIREMGTVLAMGTSRGQLFAQLVTEGLLLGLAGAAVGVALGWGFGTAINRADLSYVPPGGSEPVPLGVLLDASTAALPAAVGVGAAMLSAVLPAWTASRIQVVEALRHV